MVISVGKLLPRATVLAAVAYGVWPTVSETLWPPAPPPAESVPEVAASLFAEAAAASLPRPFQRQTDYATAAGDDAKVQLDEKAGRTNGPGCGQGGPTSGRREIGQRACRGESQRVTSGVLRSRLRRSSATSGWP